MAEPSINAEDRHDVIIVGGGLVGATLAVLLADTKLSVALIETRLPSLDYPAKEAPFDPRVSALTVASKRLLQNMRVWDAIECCRHSPFQKMRVWDADGTGDIAFDCADLGVPALGYIVENSVVVAALYERLAKAQNIRLYAPAEISDRGREREGGHWLTLNTKQTLRGSLLIGADGGQSLVREYAGIPVRQDSYDQSAIVTTVKLSQSHQRTAWQRFLPSGPLAFLPLLRSFQDENYCSIVWSLDTAEAEENMQISDTDFKLALGRAFENRLGEIIELDKRFAFPLIQRHAETYFDDRIALVGDAAHTIHPLAGQGVNLGLMDAGVLAEEILKAESRGLEIYHESVLARYQRRRLGENQLMMTAVRGFKELFGQTDVFVRWLRSTGMSWVNQVSPLKQQIIQHAMGLSGDLPEAARREDYRETRL